MATILCVDDEPAVGVVLEDALQRINHHPVLVTSVDDALDVLRRTSVDLILSDYRMPEATGLDLLTMLKRRGHDIPVIMMTGYSSIENAVLAIRSGAIDYLTKPVRPETLEIAVNQALEVVRLRAENNRYRREINSLRSRRTLVGDSPAFRSVMDMIETVAPTRATVLLSGESGTGKELFARAIHDQSPRHDKPFVTINCAALPDGLVESALFGHEKGAFTGATARTAGAFERADGGTLLLDEVSEMRLELQSKLLRVIQEHEFERVGGQQTIRVDVRMVATTNRDLKAAVGEGTFREDLYYRLNVVPIVTPPLRERRSDIPALVRHVVQRLARDDGTSVTTVAAETMDLLQQYDWPGNVRELGNAVERAVILSRGDTLLPEAFAGTLDGAARQTKENTTVTAEHEGDIRIPAGVFNLGEVERILIDGALRETGGNRTRAAKLLGISERTLRNKLNVKRDEPVVQTSS